MTVNDWRLFCSAFFVANVVIGYICLWRIARIDKSSETMALTTFDVNDFNFLLWLSGYCESQAMY